MSRVSPWLDGKVEPDVRTLTHNELLDVWAANRNSLIGAMAADEMMKRLHTNRKETKK